MRHSVYKRHKKEIDYAGVRLFCMYLKTTNAYLSWRKNSKYNIKNLWGHQNDISELINESFFWRGTMEGYDFWSKLHEDWRNIYDSLGSNDNLWKFLGKPALLKTQNGNNER